LLNLFNEILSRRARAQLRAAVNSAEHAATMRQAHALLGTMVRGLPTVPCRPGGEGPACVLTPCNQRVTLPMYDPFAQLGVDAESAPQPTEVDEREPSMEAVREGCSRAYKLPTSGSVRTAESLPMALEGTSPPIARSALCVVPPREAWGRIQAIRQAHDPAFARWPPHVNMLWPFVPRDDCTRLEPQVVAALARVPPFRVTLSRFGTFAGATGCTMVFLEVEAAEMQARLIATWAWARRS
jgi:hypothetical protein